MCPPTAASATSSVSGATTLPTSPRTSPVPSAVAVLTQNPAVDTARRFWRSRTPVARASTGIVKVVGSFAILLIGIHVALRHNAPPAGVIFFGAIIGLLYALVAFGLILIYRANRIINFAQAEMGAAPAVLAVLLIKVHHFPYLVALPIALGAGLLAGLLVEMLIIRRFATAPRLVLSVVTIGVALLFALVQFYLPKWLGAGFLVDP